MPGQGYSTIGLKPVILEELQKVTEEHFPGMFLPSTLIIIMNEIKRGRYSVISHKFRINLVGKYNSITIRSDVKEWLQENYRVFGEEYQKKYRVKSFAQFLSYFLFNVFLSKAEAQNHVIKLNVSDFKWLIEEYKKRRMIQNDKTDDQTFDQFASIFLKELLIKINDAKKILTT